MSLNVGELHALLRLDDAPFRRTLGGIPGALGGVGVAVGAAVAGIGTALAGAAAAGLHEFAGFQRGMNEVFTLLPGITGQAMDRMKEQVRQTAVAMGVVPDEVVPALYQALSAGVPQGNVFEFLEQANRAAVGGVTDLTTAVSGITGVVNAYGDQIGGAGEASDLMFTAVRLGTTTFDELAGSLGNVTPVAAANGIAFQDVTAALATITSVTQDTAGATTMLRQAIIELSDSGTQVGQAFEQVAGKSFRDFIAEGGNLSEALGLLEEHAGNTGVTVDQLFGSVEAGQAALNLTGNQAGAFASNLEEMAGSAGATEAAYEQMDQGLSRSWDKIKSAGMVLLGHLGEELAPAFEEFADWVIDNLPEIQATAVDVFEKIGDFITETLMPAFEDLSAWWEENGPEIIDTAERIGNTITTVFETISTVTTTVKEALERTFGEGSEGATAMSGFAERAEGWGIQLDGIFRSAMDAITGAVGVALGVLGGLWERYGDDIMMTVTGVWEGIQDFIDGALGMVQGTFEAFAGLFTGDWSRMWEGIKRTFQGSWDAITALLRTAVAVIQGAIGAFVETVQNLWDNFTRAVSTAWDSLWTGITNFFRDTWANLQGMWDRAVATVTTKWQEWTASLRRVWDGLWDGITNAFTGAWDRLRGLWDGAVAAVTTKWDEWTTNIRSVWDGLWDGITNGWGNIQTRIEGLFEGLVSRLGAIWDGIRNVLAAPVNWIAEHVINGLIGAVNRVSSALGAGNVLGALSTPLIPTFHSGGVVGEGGTLTSGPIQPGERLVKVRDGEEVLTEDNPRHRDNTPDGVVGDPDAGAEPRFAVAGSSNVGVGASGSANVQEGLLSGLAGAIGDAAYSTLQAARELIVNSVRPGLEALARMAASGVGGMGPWGQVAGQAGESMVDRALDWLAGVSDDIDEQMSQGLGGALEWARGQAGKPYLWGGVGPLGFDCSGFMSAIANVALGRNPHSRIFATGSIIPGGAGPFRPGSGGAFDIGAFRGNPGHTSGTLLGVNVESRGGQGVVIGPSARGANHPMYTHRFTFAGLARGGQTTLDGLHLVGEDGPELLNLPRQSTVIPLSALGTANVGGMAQVTLQQVWDRTLEGVLASTATWGQDLARTVEEHMRTIAASWDTLAADITAHTETITLSIGGAIDELARSLDGAAVAVGSVTTSLDRLEVAAAALSAQVAAATPPDGAAPPVGVGLDGPAYQVRPGNPDPFLLDRRQPGAYGRAPEAAGGAERSAFVSAVRAGLRAVR